MELRYQDAGSEHPVRVGERIEITLPERPTTGYRWHVDALPPELQQTDDRYDGADEPRGAGGNRILGFEAVRPGVVTLQLQQRRSWEQDATDRFSVQLRVLAD